MTTNQRFQFLIDPDIIYLNHGSFGACPRPVFEVYQSWQRELERNPTDFFARKIGFPGDGTGPLYESRKALGDLINVSAANLFLTINVTVAINAIARSFQEHLQPGDEILTTDHKYGTIAAAWEQVCEKSGAILKRHELMLPVTTHEDFVESFWSAVTPRTKVIVISHITSPTALILPIGEICRRAREAGIISVIDGAHAPGQIPVDIQTINPDFYGGNCHKWLCAPKGSAFLYVRPEHQGMLEPLVISWAWVEELPFSEVHSMWGTRDQAAWLSIPAAIEFQKKHNWPVIRERCHQLLKNARQQIIDLTGLPPIAPADKGWFRQMASMQLPALVDAKKLRLQLFEDYRIEVPVFEWNGRNLIRISVQGYNTPDDLKRLFAALGDLL